MADGKRYVVAGPVAVVPTRDGSERYMYRGAVLAGSAFSEDGIKHLLSIGLLKEAPEPVDEEALLQAVADATAARQAREAADAKAAEEKAAAEKAAAARAAADAKAAQNQPAK